jgi:hypothetical protein
MLVVFVLEEKAEYDDKNEDEYEEFSSAIALPATILAGNRRPKGVCLIVFPAPRRPTW